MGIREAMAIETSLGNTDLTLDADAGESLLVRGIYVYNPASTHVTVRVGQSTVGYFRVSGTQGNHLYFPTDSDDNGNLLDRLIDLGIHRGFPVPEGETFALSGAAQADAVQTVIYSRHDAADHSDVDPNGPKAAELDYIAYGRAASSLADGDNDITDIVNPTEFSGFPFEDVTPSNRSITLFGVALSDVGKASGTQANRHISAYLRLIHERVTLFDKDRNGLLVYGTASTSADQTDVAAGQSIIGGSSDVDARAPLIFPEPVIFGPTEELNVILTTSLLEGSANLAAADGEVAMILRSGR